MSGRSIPYAGFAYLIVFSTGARAQTTTTLNPNQIAQLHWYAANQTTQFSVGTNPTGLAFDGENVWVANSGSSNIMKLRASDGELVGTFSLSGNPSYVAFDG